jgi:hypothetical protein
MDYGRGIHKINSTLNHIDITTIIAYSFFHCLPAVLLEGQGEYRMTHFGFKKVS